MDTIKVDINEYTYVIGFFPEISTREESEIILRVMHNISACNNVAISVGPDGWVNLFVGSIRRLW